MWGKCPACWRKLAFSLLLVLPISLYIGWIFIFLDWKFPADPSERGLFGDSFGVLTCLYSGLGAVGLILTISQQNKQIANQEDIRLAEVSERRSLFNLHESDRALGAVRSLLQDGNCDRVTWIRASRLLKHAEKLSEGITVEEHQIAHEMNQLEYRSFFDELLSSRTAPFFYGATVIDDLDEAARESTALEYVNGRPGNRLASIPEQAIHAVWKAGQWPKDYNEPLGETFSSEDYGKLIFRHRGLREYLDHRKMWHSVMGNLYRRENEKDR